MTQKKPIQKKENKALSNFGSVGSSLENVDPSLDVTIPRILLLQAGSDAIGQGAKPGNFYNKVAAEEVEELNIVPMYLFKQRIYFNEEEIVCRSSNSLISDQGMNAGQRCDQCEFSQWKKDKSGNNIPPICRLSNNFLVYTLEDIKEIKAGKFLFPKVLSFAKTAYQCSKDIISTALFMGKDLFCFGFTLKSVQRKKDKFNYFVPIVDGHEEMPRDTIVKLAAIAPRMKSLVGRVEIELKDVSDGTPESDDKKFA